MQGILYIFRKDWVKCDITDEVHVVGVGKEISIALEQYSVTFKGFCFPFSQLLLAFYTNTH